jgi:hypothetical protein
MIFRRLAGALASQDWLVVIIEVMVVVVGIFIGLQVGDWNEARKERNDEQVFLARLHADVLLAEELSARLRDRRVQTLESSLRAADIIFNRVDRHELSDVECKALVGLGYFNINVLSLSSVSELAGTGRMNIIRDRALRSSLVRLEQTQAALATYIIVQTTSVSGRYMHSVFPELIKLKPFFNTELGEVQNKMECDLALMQSNQPFLNDFGISLDRYDAYIRDGLAPWIKQSDEVHDIVDGILGIAHEPIEAL